MSVRIIVGDARDLVAGLDGVKCVITDPVWPNAPQGMFPATPDPYDTLATTLRRLPASVERLVIVMRNDCDPRFLRAVPSSWPFVLAAWLRYALPGFRGRTLTGNEVAYCFGTPPPARPGRRLLSGQCPHAAQPHKSEHPCPRARIHMEWLIEQWTDPGDLILDPFAGSGTTGVAAQHLGRDSILVEISPEYARMAEQRIRDDNPMFADVRIR